MANKTIEPITIDGQEADAFMINTSFCQMGRCKVQYSIGDFNPDPAPGSFNALSTKSMYVDYDEDSDGEMYEFLLTKIAEREGFTVTGEIIPPTPDS